MHNIERIAIAGVPNCGKTTLFNSLTGSRQKVGNWPGVTVEKIEGSIVLDGRDVKIIDLPGAYNLSPDSEDQKVAERFIRAGKYDLLLNVVDATNLSRNLYLTMDLKERTNHIVILLNMLDVAEKEGLEIDLERLGEELGLPVIPIVAVKKDTVADALKQIEQVVDQFQVHDVHVSLPEGIESEKKFKQIDTICNRVVCEKKDGINSFTNKVDSIVMDRFAAIPIFLAAMFVTFWFAIGLGSVFIDFFDILGGLAFVDIPATILEKIGSSEWLIVISAGVGAGCQTVATFVPVVFFMFLALAILEDLGYMARVGVIADRFMRKIGLPGSAFIPMIVGFGCTVPAVMAARTLNTKRDRFMTIFMAPFMSCGARLPVYALFCAAMFGAYSGLAVFAIYLTGLFMAILTGYLLKNTLFKGTPSHFIMDLPHYHVPKVEAVFRSASLRTKNFIKRAGSIVVIAVFVLATLNTIGVQDGEISFGNEGSQSSFLANAGKSIGPVFEPMGINEKNWPASVALFTGLFAKEAIVGTINSLYATMDHSMVEETGVEDSGELDVVNTVKEAFISVGEGFVGVVSSFDILGVGLISEDANVISEEIGADTAVYKQIAQHFTIYSAFAYLLFVLMYFPCLAVVGAARQEMGGFYAGVMALYSTLLAWAVATLFYQVTEGHDVVYILLSFFILSLIYGGLHILGKREKVTGQVSFAPPIRKHCCS